MSNAKRLYEIDPRYANCQSGLVANLLGQYQKKIVRCQLYVFGFSPPIVNLKIAQPIILLGKQSSLFELDIQSFS